MTDLISRADAIADLEELAERYNGTVTADGVDLAIDRIKALPSSDAVQGWIPCSERLPSEDGHYLVCMSWEHDNMDVLRWADGWNCYRDYDGKICRENEIDGVDIIAWMPLPKPYREDGE